MLLLGHLKLGAHEARGAPIGVSVTDNQSGYDFRVGNTKVDNPPPHETLDPGAKSLDVPAVQTFRLTLVLY